MRRGVGLLLLGASLLSVPGAAAAPEAAEQELVERVLRETGVEDRPERPRLGDYLHHLLGHLLASPAARGSGRLVARAFELALWVLVGLAAGAVVWLLWVAMRARRGRAPVADPAGRIELADAPSPPARSAARWREEIDACLAGGDLAGALTAAWWWIATASVDGDAQPSWTTRDAARRSVRPGVASLLRRLDRMAFGLTRPDGEQIRAIVNDADRLVA